MATAGARIVGPHAGSNSNETLYTSTGVTTDVKSIIVSNGTTADCWISLAINGTSATLANCFIYQLNVPGGGVFTYDGFLWLASGDTLQGIIQTNAALQITASGITQ